MWSIQVREITVLMMVLMNNDDAASILDVSVGATRGVAVSMSAFLALPPMLLRGFESRLGLESSGCSTWHF